MKTSIIFILLINLFCVSCSKPPEIVSKPNTPPIFEVSQNAQGMWDVTGKTLFFRLYENGFVEFGYPDEAKKINGQQFKAEEINSLKQSVISTDELQQFIEIIKSDDFQKISSSYKRKCCCTDTVLDYKITVGQKNIDLNSFCNTDELTDPQNRYYPPDFPKGLSDLMKRTELLRWKLILPIKQNKS